MKRQSGILLLFLLLLAGTGCSRRDRPREEHVRITVEPRVSAKTEAVTAPAPRARGSLDSSQTTQPRKTGAARRAGQRTR